jgi:hypothetical protein
VTSSQMSAKPLGDLSVWKCENLLLLSPIRLGNKLLSQVYQEPVPFLNYWLLNS